MLDWKKGELLGIKHTSRPGAMMMMMMMMMMDGWMDGRLLRWVLGVVVGSCTTKRAAPLHLLQCFASMLLAAVAEESGTVEGPGQCG